MCTCCLFKGLALLLFVAVGEICPCSGMVGCSVWVEVVCTLVGADLDAGCMRAALCGPMRSRPSDRLAVGGFWCSLYIEPGAAVDEGE